ncbi:MAG: hypothetical protein WCH58_04355 [Candidatus Saccharibacteria bacterium]
MTKTININKQVGRTNKKILITSLIVLSPVILFVIYALYNLVSAPMLDRADHDRFNTLDTQMHSLFDKIKVASNSNERWSYSSICESQLSGDWPTGKYICTTLMSTNKTVRSVRELNDLQEKYFPLVNSSNVFIGSNGSDIQSTEAYSKRFAVSLAYKDLTEIKSNTKCIYTIQLNQTPTNTNYQKNNSNLGYLIDGGEGIVDITLRCSDIARNYWYALSNSNTEPVLDTVQKK